MRHTKIFGLYFIAGVVSLVVALVAAGVSCHTKPVTHFMFEEITESAPIPIQGACFDTISEVLAIAPNYVFQDPVTGWIFKGTSSDTFYSLGLIVPPYVALENRLSSDGVMIQGGACDSSVDMGDSLVISGQVGIDNLPGNYWIMVSIEGHPQPFGLLVGEYGN